VRNVTVISAETSSSKIITYNLLCRVDFLSSSSSSYDLKKSQTCNATVFAGRLYLGFDSS